MNITRKTWWMPAVFFSSFLVFSAAWAENSGAGSAGAKVFISNSSNGGGRVSNDVTISVNTGGNSGDSVGEGKAEASVRVENRGDPPIELHVSSDEGSGKEEKTVKGGNASTTIRVEVNKGAKQSTARNKTEELPSVSSSINQEKLNTASINSQQKGSETVSGMSSTETDAEKKEGGIRVALGRALAKIKLYIRYVFQNFV